MCPNAMGKTKFLLLWRHTDRRGARLFFAGNRCFVVSIACHGSEPKPLSRRLSRFQAAGRFFRNPLGEKAFTGFIILERDHTAVRGV